MVLSGCRRGGGGPAAPIVTPAAQKTAILVTTAPAVRRSISDTANITGALNSLNDVTVGIKNAGKIVAVYAREGDMVHAQQPVAQQDTTDLQSQLQQQLANLHSAQSKLEQAQAAYDSAKTNLALTDATTKSAVDQARAGLKSAQDSLILLKRGARPQELEQSRKNIDAAQADLDSAKADQNQAVSDLKRYQDLRAAGAISAQQLDQARTTKLAADARVNSSLAHLEAAKQAYNLQQEGAQPEDINRSQAAVDQAQQVLQSAISNRSQVDLRRADLETARTNIDAARAGIQQAQAQVAVSQQALRDSVIRSPIEGMVAERKVEPGMQVAITKPDVMRIVDLSAIYFDGQLSQTQYSEVHPGQSVTVMVDAIPGRIFQGTVSKIYPVASTTARSFTVRISIRNEGKLLRPQMFARGQITLGTHRNAVVIPREAVLDMQDDGTKRTGSVFVVENSKAHKVSVTLGYTNTIEDEILSGVKAGDAVVTVGQAQIQEGDPVQVSKNAVSTSAP